MQEMSTIELNSSGNRNWPGYDVSHSFLQKTGSYLNFHYFMNSQVQSTKRNDGKTSRSRSNERTMVIKEPV